MFPEWFRKYNKKIGTGDTVLAQLFAGVCVKRPPTECGSTKTFTNTKRWKLTKRCRGEEGKREQVKTKREVGGIKRNGKSKTREEMQVRRS